MAAQPKVPVKRFYVRDSKVAFDEDYTHEFKGHMNLSEEEIPPWTVVPNSDRRTRAPISRAINGFLNTGVGGTVYIGVTDDGTVKGINLTQFRKDHFYAAMDDLMGRYDPPVSPHRYSIKFVPIVDPETTEEERQQIVSFDTRVGVDKEERLKSHTLRTHRYCWCDNDAVARQNHGELSPDYIIELVIHPWDCGDSRNLDAIGVARACPLHVEETGKVYIRRQATVVACTSNEIQSIAKNRVQEHYQPIIERLKDDLKRLRQSVA